MTETPPPPVSVLAYHNIVDAGQESPNDIHSIPINRLNEQVAALDDAGFVQMPLVDAFHRLIHSRDRQPGYVLTFDDGYVSLLKYMDRMSVRAAPSAFILTDYSGRSTASWNTRSSVARDHLDVGEIRALLTRGFDIQLHGVDHHNLLKFDVEQLRSRFRQARDWFNEHLGKAPEFLAYPYGYCDHRIKRVAAEFFHGALSMTHGEWAGPEARYALNRVGVPYFLTGDDLVSVLQTPPDQRWYEIERRAPWRRSSHD
jgi:peptidoglycan/xylan/chitin deacetylase (PgdA/CDA1 family)